MEVGWRDFGFLLDVFECCFEFLLNVVFEFFLNVVIFPEQRLKLCQNCEKYFSIPVHSKRRARRRAPSIFRLSKMCCAYIAEVFQVRAIVSDCSVVSRSRQTCRLYL